MVDYDRYVLGTWADTHGISFVSPISVRRPKQSASGRFSKYVKTAFRSSVVAVGMVISGATFLADVSVAAQQEIIASEAVYAFSSDADVPAGYWKSLTTVLSNASKLVPDNHDFDPSPLA